MALFRTNYENNNEKASYGPLPQGEYEMIINSVQEKVTPNGKISLSFDLVVRNDLTKVPQLAETNGKYANRHVFNDNWMRTINGNYQHDWDRLQEIFEAAGVPENTAFNTMDDVFQALTHKPVKVYVKVEYSDYNKRDENTVAPWGYSKTDYPNVSHEFKYGKTEQSQPIEVGTDDLPF